MIIKAESSSYFVFDLDDTLYSEIDYLKSAFKSIAKELEPVIFNSLYDEMLRLYLSGGNTFKFLIEKFPEKNLTVEKLLYLYRNHYPNITLRVGVLEMFKEIRKKNGKIGLITDGRSITQRNKIQALGIEEYFSRIVISEEFGCQKPSVVLFESFMGECDNLSLYYFGDNILKDFIAPRKLGWNCIGLLNDENIHKKEVLDIPSEFLPHFFINKFTEIEIT
jgi:putative hydrolase of the HAD superfamily